jgi:hypothetical protein
MNLLSQIYEGWRNKLIPPSDIKHLITEVSNERKKICDECEWNSVNRKASHGYKTSRPDEHCVKCGCTLDAKRKCLSCECPLKMWLAQMEQEQYLEIKADLENDNSKD